MARQTRAKKQNHETFSEIHCCCCCSEFFFSLHSVQNTIPNERHLEIMNSLIRRKVITTFFLRDATFNHITHLFEFSFCFFVLLMESEWVWAKWNRRDRFQLIISIRIRSWFALLIYVNANFETFVCFSSFHSVNQLNERTNDSKKNRYKLFSLSANRVEQFEWPWRR